MLPLIVSSLAVLAILLLAGLYWRWQLRGLLLGGVFLIAVIFAYASGLALVYSDSSTLPKALSRFDFFIGAIIGAVCFVAGALMSVLALETRRGPSRTISEILSRMFQSKPRRGAEWQVIDGVIRQTRAPDLGVTEPGKIIIPKNHALIFEDDSGKFSRAEFGPIVVQERPNDKPKIVVVTRPRFKRFSISNLLTADGVPIDRVDFSLLYELEMDPNLRPTENIQHPISGETLVKAVYGVAQWEDGKQSEAETWQTAVEETAKNIVRAQFAQTYLLQLFERDQPAMQVLGDNIKTSVNAQIAQWGVVINTLQIDHLALPRHIQERLEERWMSERMKAIRLAEGEAEGERIKKIEAAKGEAWSKLIEQMCKSLKGDLPLALQYVPILEYLDSVSRSSQTGSSTLWTPVSDLLSLVHALEQKQAQDSALRRPDPGQGQRPFEGAEEEKKVNIIGSEPEKKSPPEGKRKPDEAVS